MTQDIFIVDLDIFMIFELRFFEVGHHLPKMDSSVYTLTSLTCRKRDNEHTIPHHSLILKIFIYIRICLQYTMIRFTVGVGTCTLILNSFCITFCSPSSQALCLLVFFPQVSFIYILTLYKRSQCKQLLLLLLFLLFLLLFLLLHMPLT